MRDQYWVLQERNTGLLMPSNKVATRAEFHDNGLPRLFNSRGAAKQALDCWRMGHWRHAVDSYGESEGPQPPDPSKRWNADVIARRKDIAVDIVPVRLSLLPN